MASGQNLKAERLLVGMTDGDQTLTPTAYKNNNRIWVSGVSVAGRVINLPAVAELKLFVTDDENDYPVTVRMGSTDISLDPGTAHFLETDGTANGLQDATGAAEQSGFSSDTPLPDATVGNPGSSVFSARSDHVHPLGDESWQTVTHADSPVPLVPGRNYDFDTSAGPITGTLVGDPAKFDQVGIRNSAQSFSDFALTVSRNGHTIMAVAEDMTFNTDGVETALWFNGTTWQFPGAQL